MALSSTTKKYPYSKAICNFRFTKSISSSMGFSLTRLNRVLIQPCEPTPSVVLDLSLIDNIPVLRCFARTIHVFTHAPDAARVIKEALAKALVSYYPLSGRMKELNQGKIQIDCTGKTGIWFVDAVTDFTLESICHFDNLMEIPYDDLLPDQIPEGDNEEPLVQMQVSLQFVFGIDWYTG